MFTIKTIGPGPEGKPEETSWNANEEKPKMPAGHKLISFKAEGMAHTKIANNFLNVPMRMVQEGKRESKWFGELALFLFVNL